MTNSPLINTAICDPELLNSLLHRDLSCAPEWTNIIVAIIATLAAIISALCAWHANKSSQKQAKREYFDKVCGDKFYQELTKAREFFRPIKSQLMSSNLSPEKVEAIKAGIRSIDGCKISTECFKIDEILEAEEKLTEICDDIYKQLYAIKGFIDEQEGEWFSRANSCIESIDNGFTSMVRIYLNLRNKAKIKK